MNDNFPQAITIPPHELRQCPECNATCLHKVLNDSFHCSACGTHWHEQVSITAVHGGTRADKWSAEPTEPEPLVFRNGELIRRSEDGFDAWWETTGMRRIEGTTEAAARQVWAAAAVRSVT